MSKNITSKRAAFFAMLALALLFLLTALLFYTGVLQINNPSKKKYPVRGVDVSAYQGDIDWQILSNQEIDFAYIKATEGSSFVDGKFNYNWSEASKTKLRVGAYHFFSFESLGETQAENFIGAVSEIENMLPPVVDVEPYGNFNSIEQRNIDELKVWLNLVEEHYGVRPIIYTTEKYYSFLSDNLDEYEFWLRSVYSVPRKDKDWCIWQYSNRKRLKGYNGKEKYIDMNAFYGTNEEFALFGRKKVNEKKNDETFSYDVTNVKWKIMEQNYEGTLNDFIVYLDNTAYMAGYEVDELMSPHYSLCDMNGDAKKDIIIHIDNCAGYTLIIIELESEYYGFAYSERQCQEIYSNGLILCSGGGWDGYFRLRESGNGFVEEEVASRHADGPHFLIEGKEVSMEEYDKWVDDNCRETIDFTENVNWANMN